MKTLHLMAASIVTAALVTASMLLLSATDEIKPFVASDLNASGFSYDLDITGVDSANTTLQSTNGNPIVFVSKGYGNGTFDKPQSYYQFPYLYNTTPISGLKSITVSGIENGVTFKIEYGWALEDYVNEVIIDSDNPTYSFNNDGPSFFKIQPSISYWDYNSAIAVDSITLSYSCNATIEPLEYSLSFIPYGDGYSVIGNRKKCKNVTIPSMYQNKPVISIGADAFKACSSLASVTIPSSVTSIGSYAFSGCSSLASVTIPESVTCINAHTFEYCSSLASVTIPDSVTSIGAFAFDGCSSLASVAIPDSVTSLGNYAFCGCTSLASVAIPDSVTSIGNLAFYGCSSLASMTIPSSVASMGYHAFSNCHSLTIYCESEFQPQEWDDDWNYCCAKHGYLPVVWEYHQ